MNYRGITGTARQLLAEHGIEVSCTFRDSYPDTYRVKLIIPGIDNRRRAVQLLLRNSHLFPKFKVAPHVYEAIGSLCFPTGVVFKIAR